jgi:glycosyltransferase involved in cell wall biosynthesis
MTRSRSVRWRRARYETAASTQEAELRLGEVITPGRHVHIRVLPELRTEQVNRHTQFSPSEALYFGTKFDLVSVEIPAGMRRTSLLAAMSRILRSDVAVLELPEPLWARFLPRTVCLAAAWTLSGLVRGQWRRARTYAIENNDPISALFGAPRLGRVPSRLVRMAFGVLVFLMYERIAYGSDQAAGAYRSLALVDQLESEVFPELPARPAVGGPTGPPKPRTAVFVGELAPRKGLRILLQAWKLVEERCEGAQLHVVGSGPLEGEIRPWALKRPRSRLFHGHLVQREVLHLLPTCVVLAAPSIRWNRWREQIGLPIKEALTSGLTVVTTTETGLAPWLRDHGHHVVAAPPSAASLADALAQALEHPLPRDQVIAALPAVSARLEADRWLHAETA